MQRKHLRGASRIDPYGDRHVLFLTAFAPLAALLFTFYYNKTDGAKARNLRRAWASDDLSSLINFATEYLKPIAVTLESRKVSIGLVARTNEPDHDQGYITLLPYYSGYREHETLHLHITNRYDAVFKVIDDETSEINIEDLYIVLPLGKIVSAHIFNDAVYERVNRPQTPIESN